MDTFLDTDQGDDGHEAFGNMFQEPNGYYEREAEPTFQTYILSHRRAEHIPGADIADIELAGSGGAEPHVHGGPTSATFTIRLVGQSPLWGHLLFPAGRHLADYLNNHAAQLVHGKYVLELGAGSGLPSLVCAYNAARAVVLTDYPDSNLLENLRYNRDNCAALTAEAKSRVAVCGYIWGATVQPLVSSLEVLAKDPNSCLTSLPSLHDQSHDAGSKSNTDGADTVRDASAEFMPSDPGSLITNRFETLILADLVFNHSEHHKLVSTVQQSLARTRDARALVFFTPHRPWLYEADMAFFSVATESVPVTSSHDHASNSFMLGARKVAEDEHEQWTMFEEDKTKDREDHPEDARLRRTVFGYELFWKDLQE